MYGLRQTPRAWYEKIDSSLRSQNFVKSTADHNLHVIQDNKGNNLFLLLYVDDLLFTSNNSAWITWFKNQFGSKFEMSTPREKFEVILAVEICSRYMQKPQLPHMRAVKRIWGYLSGTRGHKILFIRGEPPIITRHVDSDHAEVTENEKSTIGFLFQIGSSQVTWHSNDS